MMSDKGLNIFDVCAAECVHLPSGRIVSHLPENKMYTPDTIANSQRMTTKINKNGAIAKIKILV